MTGRNDAGASHIQHPGVGTKSSAFAELKFTAEPRQRRQSYHRSRLPLPTAFHVRILPSMTAVGTGPNNYTQRDNGLHFRHQPHRSQADPSCPPLTDLHDAGDIWVNHSACPASPHTFPCSNEIGTPIDAEWYISWRSGRLGKTFRSRFGRFGMQNGLGASNLGSRSFAADYY